MDQQYKRRHLITRVVRMYEKTYNEKFCPTDEQWVKFADNQEVCLMNNDVIVLSDSDFEIVDQGAITVLDIDLSDFNQPATT